MLLSFRLFCTRLIQQGTAVVAICINRQQPLKVTTLDRFYCIILGEIWTNVCRNSDHSLSLLTNHREVGLILSHYLHRHEAKPADYLVRIVLLQIARHVTIIYGVSYLVGPTLKVRRQVVHEKYKATIDAMYSES